MPVLKKDSAVITKVRDGLSRRFVYSPNLMMVVIDFTDGPWREPEPLQHHVHEQATYIVEGEIIFFCEGEERQNLGAGDMFWVPSGKRHGIQLVSKHAKLVDTFNPIREEFL